MNHKILSSRAGERILAAVLESGDDVLPLLQQLCEAQDIRGALVSGIGGFCKATVGFYDLEAKRYEPIAIDEQVEVLSLLGNVGEYDGKPRIHAHCIVGHRDGRTTGGHFLGALVRPTLELLIQEVPGVLRRTDRPEIGIPLIEL